MIYFIKSPAGPIKIGFTSRLSERLKQLEMQRGERLEVLAVMPGSIKVEHRLHRMFRHLRLKGEWFDPGADLLDFLAREGKRWDGRDEPTTIRSTQVTIDDSAVSWARIACEYTGEAVPDYIGRVVSERGRADSERLQEEQIARVEADEKRLRDQDWDHDFEKVKVAVAVERSGPIPVVTYVYTDSNGWKIVARRKGERDDQEFLEALGRYIADIELRVLEGSFP